MKAVSYFVGLQLYGLCAHSQRVHIFGRQAGTANHDTACPSGRPSSACLEQIEITDNC